MHYVLAKINNPLPPRFSHLYSSTERVLAETERGGYKIVNFVRKQKGAKRQPKDPKEAERRYK